MKTLILALVVIAGFGLSVPNAEARDHHRRDGDHHSYYDRGHRPHVIYRNYPRYNYYGSDYYGPDYYYTNRPYWSHYHHHSGFHFLFRF